MTIEPGAALAELRLVARAEVLVVVRRQRVQQQRQAVAAPRRRLLRDVDRVRLEPALVLARAVGRATSGSAARSRRPARARSWLPVDPVHRAGLRHACGCRARGARSLLKLTFAKNARDVAGRERVALRAVAPPRGVDDRVRALGRASGSGSSARNATLKNAAGRRASRRRRACVALARGSAAAGTRPPAASHRPTPAASRTVCAAAGSRRVCGTRTSIWRRRRSTRTGGRLRLASSSPARVSSPTSRLAVGVHGQEAARRAPGRSRRTGSRCELALRAADRDRERDERRVLQRVERHAERGRAARAA